MAAIFAIEVLGDAAGSLQHHAAVRQLHRFGEIGDIHIVEQHHVGGRLSSTSAAASSVSISISILTRWPKRAGARSTARDTAGNRDVVVLDQDGIVEAEAMVDAAAAAHGVFLERAQARRRLARVADARLGAGVWRT